MRIIVVLSLLALQAATAGAQTPKPPQPRPAQRSTAKPPTPLTLRQVIESLSATRSSRRAEDMVSKAGVQFQATPAVLDILKQFNASAKLLAMIPAPPAPPPAPAPATPKLAGAVTLICEPADCSIAVDDKFLGTTTQNKKSLTGIPSGNVTFFVFADGYEPITKRTELRDGQPAEERFVLRRSAAMREEIARALLLKAVVRLGGLAGLADVSDVDADGTLQWTTSSGSTEKWSVSLNRNPGKNLSAVFKTPDGQCTVAIASQSSRTDCKGGLRNGGDKIAEQASSLFLSYQVQDVVDTLLRRPLAISEQNENRLESVDVKDMYSLTLSADGLPAELVYKIGDTDAPILVQYSNYVNAGKGWAPGRIAIGRLNGAPAWVFTLTSVRGPSGRGD